MAPPRLARVPLRHAGRHAGRTLRYYVEGESWSPTTSYAVASYSWRMALRSCGDLRIGGATKYNSYPWAQPASSEENGVLTTRFSIACLALSLPIFRRGRRALGSRSTPPRSDQPPIGLACQS